GRAVDPLGLGSSPVTATTAKRLAIAVTVVGVAACALSARGPAPAIPARATAVFPAGWRFHAGEAATRSSHAMVVSNSDIASRVGADIMRRGGNAIDAAVAVGFAMTVTYPVAGNIGGGGFMVI